MLHVALWMWLTLKKVKLFESVCLEGASVSVKQSGRIGRQTFTSNHFSLRAQQPDFATDVQQFSVPRKTQYIFLFLSESWKNNKYW